MSHSSSKPNVASSSRPSQAGASVSPLNALSNQPTRPHAYVSTNPILSNKLIPRDYLTSRSKLTPTASQITPDATPVGSEAGAASYGSITNVKPCLGSTSDGPISQEPDDNPVVRNDSAGTPDKETTDVNDDLLVQRTRSPDSVVTDSTVLSSKPTIGLSSRTLHNNMPRTSSIDSAISSVSASSAQRKDQGDARDPSPSSIRGLISTAGSAENLVLHLLKEKNHAASQNTQLWKLVEKQRALLLGLNKDLERVTKDRDRYKKRLKELQSQGAIPNITTQSHPRGSIDHTRDNAVKPPEVPRYDSAGQHSTADSASTGVSSPIDAPGPAIITIEDVNAAAVPSVNNSRPTLQAQTAGLAQPTFAVTEATPLNEKSSKGFLASRSKAAPKPLNLLQKPEKTAPPLVDQSLINEGGDEPRGRRKTREEDDQEREKSLIKEQEARSKSKKSVEPPPQSESQTGEVLAPPTVAVALPASPRPLQGLAPNNTLNAPQLGSLQERHLLLPLRSPGLPASPRPMMNNVNNMNNNLGLPMSPRAPPPGPLSPRAPKQHVPPPMMSPSPFADPAVVQKQNAMARQAAQQSYQQSDRLQIHEPSISNDIPSVYQGLVSSQYPNLLLPPNALPSIQIQVASSRLRPSRHSMLGLRTQEDSTVFSLSIIARASRNELWRLEKIPAALPQLEQQLRPYCKDLPKLPDRRLFSGHSPAIVDDRRQAVDAYFEELLDLEMDEPSALVICRFLSTDVLDPSSEPPKHPGVHQDSLPQNTSLNGKVVKTGFLTKRGKNFGGWKSRYFVLDSHELRYYDTPGGPQIGTIRISHAKIGIQKPEDPASTDPDDQYRHAFLVQEPKKKDSAAYVRHILCAESDADRDQWVAALLHYVEGDGHKELDSPSVSTIASFMSRPPTSSGKEKLLETHSNTPSPVSPASLTDISIGETMSRSTNISGPMNGAPIQDSTQWGNKHPAPREKSSKMNIFHFKKSSQEHLNQHSRTQDGPSKPRVLRHNGYVRAVFGLPLADAVEFCSPFNLDVTLPAVVYRSIEYLRFRRAANEEGLFRLSGSNIVVKTLKERFNTEGDIDLVDEQEYYDIHAVASLFKTYLRELPSPILTRDLHIEFLKVLEMESQDDKVTAFNVLVHRLPSVNFELLRALSEYLLEVTDNVEKNKMSIRNMGIVFSPTINIPPPVFNLFLSEFEAIFGSDPADRHAPAPGLQQDALHAPTNLAPAEIRSPRHQMFSDIPTPAYHQTSFDTSSAQSAPTQQRHQPSSSGEFGFTPLHPSYENGQYVSNPQEMRTQAYSPPQTIQQPQVEGEEQYGSLNRILVPQGATTDKRRKRESAMLF